MKKWFKKHKKGTIILSVVVVAAIAAENIAKGEGINAENAGKAKHHTII